MNGHLLRCRSALRAHHTTAIPRECLVPPGVSQYAPHAKQCQWRFPNRSALHLTIPEQAPISEYSDALLASVPYAE